MPLTQSSLSDSFAPNSWLLGQNNNSQGILNPGGMDTLNNYKPPSIGQNAPGIVPQVYPGSTGQGTNQQTSTPMYGGYTPGPNYNYTPSWSSNQQNNNQGASAYDAFLSSQGNKQGQNLNQGFKGPNTNNPFGSGNLTGNGIASSWNSFSPQEKATYIQANPTLAAQQGLSVQNQNPGSFGLNGVTDNITTGAQQSNANPNVGTSTYNSPTNTGPNPNPGNIGDPFSGMNGLYAQMLGDYYNRTKQYDNSDLDVNKATQELSDYEKNYGNALAGFQGNNNWSIDTQQGKAQVLGNQAANVLPYLQTKLNQATTLRGQNLGAMSDIAGKLQPKPYDVYMDPVTGQPINQGGASNALFQKGVNMGIQNQGYNNAGSVVSVQQAQQLNSQFISQLNASPDFQSNPVSVVNAIFNYVKGQTSDPKYAGLSTQFGTIVNTLSNVLGQDTVNKALELVHSDPKSMSSVLNNLISQANTKAQNMNPGNQQNNNGSNGGSGGNGNTQFAQGW